MTSILPKTSSWSRQKCSSWTRIFRAPFPARHFEKGRRFMSEAERRLEVLRQWVAKAENDLIVATHLLRMRKECPVDAVCFHAQQAAEKYIKAYLVFQDVDFPKFHDLAKLTKLIP